MRGTLLRLVRARYQLQWARARRNPLAVFLFVAGQLLLLTVLLVLTTSSLAGAAVAVAGGQGERAARLLLSGVFLNAVVASTILGYGLTQVFSDAVLRRYPLSRTERFAARQLLALFEPLWLITMAVYAGSAIGFAVFGAAPIWHTLPAVLLLAIGNYLLTRLAIALGDRAMASSAGQVTLFLLFNVAILSPQIVRSVGQMPAVRGPLMALLEMTPPAAAGAVLAGAATSSDVAVLVLWTVVMAAGLLFVETRPPSVGNRRETIVADDGWLDRLARAAPVQHPALVTKTMRYGMRYTRARMQIAVGLLGGGFLIFQQTRGDAASSSAILTALIASALIGVLPTLELDANMFGYEKHGMRRLLLLPVQPARVLRTASITSLVAGLLYAFIAIGVWSLLFDALADPRVTFLMLCSAGCGVLFLRGVAAWTSVLLPRSAEYGNVLRNQGGGGLQIVTITGFAIVGIMLFLRPAIASGALLRSWWMAPAALLPFALFYVGCLSLAGTALNRRRERVLAAVEQR